MNTQIAYLGPAGTYSEAAAAFWVGALGGVTLAQPDMEAVVASVADGRVEYAVLPLENSAEGTVNQTLDLIIKENRISLAGDLVLPIRHALLVRPGTRWEDISTVLSHPQALAQCRGFLSRNRAGMEVVEVSSTAEAARQVAGGGPGQAAIAPPHAAAIYGLQVLAENLGDMPNNETRFILLARRDNPVAMPARTSLLIYVHDRPGALYLVLQEFYTRGINLTKIESRPARTKLGDYVFFIDVEGSRQQDHIAQALDQLAQVASAVRMLGSYPRYEFR